MKKTVTLILFLLSFSLFQIKAAPASRNVQTEKLPDGTSISYVVNGDENYHYILSTDGYVLMKNNDGFYCYSQKDEKDYLVAGSVTAHNVDGRTSEEILFLKTITPFMEYHPDQIALFLKKERSEIPLKKNSFSVFSNENTNPNAQKHKKNIVILVEFSDLFFNIENPQEKYSNLLNKEGYDYNGATGSVRDYFIKSSFGAFQPDFDVVGPYRLAKPMSYYESSNAANREMVVSACRAADAAGINFQQYSTDGNFVDNICIIFAGFNDAEYTTGTHIWPHCSNLGNFNTVCDERKIYDYICTSELRLVNRNPLQSEICGIGIFTHEFSHLLGLPDLYNTNNDRIYVLNQWSIMDGGLYSNKGHTPPTFSSYERFYMGWLTPEILDEPVVNINLPDLIDSNKAYIIAPETPDLNGYNPTPNEFFLIENRQLNGFDAYLPYHGMLIWHIHYNQTAWKSIPSSVNTNTSQRVYLVRADGTQIKGTSETGDPFPGITDKTSYSPTLWNETDLYKPIYCIEETNGIIKFNFNDDNCILSLNSTSNDAINIWSGNKLLHILGVQEKTQLEILQIDGKIIEEKLLTDSFNEIYIPKTGLYIVKLKSKNVSLSYKIIIK